MSQVTLIAVAPGKSGCRRIGTQRYTLTYRNGNASTQAYLLFLTFLAASGLGMYLLPSESELPLLGIILLIFWLPMALRHSAKYARQRASLLLPAASPPEFGSREAHVSLEAAFSVTIGTEMMRADSDILELRCLLAPGTDGFSARLWRADNITGPWPCNEKIILNVQFLVPDRALPRFPADTIAQVLLRDTFVGSVKVLSANAPESVA